LLKCVCLDKTRGPIEFRFFSDRVSSHEAWITTFLRLSSSLDFSLPGNRLPALSCIVVTGLALPYPTEAYTPSAPHHRTSTPRMIRGLCPKASLPKYTNMPPSCWTFWSQLEATQFTTITLNKPLIFIEFLLFLISSPAILRKSFQDQQSQGI
jgi:hypothetical protein